MIPLKLTLQNFLSYGPKIQTVDFTSYRLICLSGKNGHGKSALLDAITWALWGQARKTSNMSKPDHGVIHLGQANTMVIFDFMFNNITYRVRRVFSVKYGKPHAHIDFGTLDTATDYFHALTEKTMRKTQERIDTIIGLSYDSFINSCFLRQGQSNEFSKKSPKERKEVLATILGITRYEKARMLASEKMRATTQEKEFVHKIIERISQECSQKQELEQEQKVLQEQLVIREQQEQTYVQQKIVLENAQQETAKEQKKYVLLQFELQQKQEERAQQETKFFALLQQWKQAHKQLIQVPDKTDLEIKKLALIRALQEQQENTQKLLVIREQLLKLKEQEHELLQNFKKKQLEKSQVKTRIIEKLKAQEFAYITKQQELEQEYIKLEQEKVIQATECANLQKTIDPELLICDTQELQKRFDRYKTTYQSWIEQGNWVTKELYDLQEKERLSQTTDNPSCPLCEQNLTLARKRFLLTKFNTKKQFYTHKRAKLTRLISWIKELLVKQHHAVETNKKIDSYLQKQEELTKLLADKKLLLTTLLQELVHTKKAIIDQTTEFEQEESRAQTDFLQNQTYKNLRDQQELLEKNYTQLSEQTLTPIHTEARPTLHEQIHELDIQLAFYTTLAEQRVMQNQRSSQIHELIIRIKQIKRAEIKLQEALLLYNYLSEKINLESKNQAELTENLQKLSQEKEKIMHKKGALENALQKLHAHEQEQKKLELQITQLELEYVQYQAIAQAFSKDGIQALLIDEALPEIENEANDLLSRLTDNQTHIFIESLRDLKRGGTRETLDINISDNSGIRAYELFSGGEAFRIDFALRIALSKLLARRAGTSLQTLIIDEGFGSQDDEGLSRIMDVIYKIQDDFEKIIIVSHLNSMKDQFPVHFIVEKSPQGSQLVIKELA